MHIFVADENPGMVLANTHTALQIARCAGFYDIAQEWLAGEIGEAVSASK